MSTVITHPQPLYGQNLVKAFKLASGPIHVVSLDHFAAWEVMPEPEENPIESETAEMIFNADENDPDIFFNSSEVEWYEN